MEGSLTSLHAVARATVTLGVEVAEDHPSVPVLGMQRFGTGVVVGPGRILTVNYVVLGAERIAVTDTDGAECDAVVLAQDFFTGVSVVGADTSLPPAIDAGDSAAVAVGDDVFTVASVGGSERRTSSGFVAGRDPFDAYWEYALESGLWVSLVNPGLGGAPLCDRSGRLVGIVSLNLGAIGRSTLAVPAEHYYDHADELLEHGRRVSRRARAWLGMFCYAVDGRMVVAGLIPGGPGDSSGLAVGDVIVSLDAEHVRDRPQLYEALWRHGPGETVAVGVLRGGDIEELDVETGDAESFFALSVS